MDKTHTKHANTRKPKLRRATLTSPAATIAIIAILTPLTGCGNTQHKTTASQPTQPTNTQPTTTNTANTQTTNTNTTTTADTSETHAPATEKIELTSPAVRPEGELPARYTCDGQNTPLPLRWKDIPAGTTELMLDIINLKPANDKLQFAYALTGLPSTSHGVNPGKLPAGTITGANSTTGQANYDLCPPKGPTAKYVAVLFALPHHIPAQPGFNPATLRLQAEHTAKYQAFYFTNYQRH